MSKLEDRKPEELRAWFEESEIACELIAHIRTRKENLIQGMIVSLRGNDAIRGARYLGANDEMDELLLILQRKPPEKK